MTLISVSQDIPLANYSMLLFFGATFSIVSFIAFIFHLKYSVKKSSIYTLIMFSFFYYLALSGLNEFYEVELDDNLITLKYAPPSKDVIISMHEIQSLTFGAEKHGACYLVFRTVSDKRYKSSILSRDVNFCKNKRREIMVSLNIKS
ncbi:hypothetical protein [Pseudoalteromonas sp. NEC-BIFX-2020_015]|uniref:hypothetical protein n=1 Tax=Pseudoalteromonas sp. NEC-BIFX-2020_015 TaxID=2729544 RepID=UPI001461654B|nr:hypothetical protein [Pseudoalteromonas sp. NEC-BIFX-2020_015]